MVVYLADSYFDHMTVLIPDMPFCYICADYLPRHLQYLQFEDQDSAEGRNVSITHIASSRTFLTCNLSCSLDAHKQNFFCLQCSNGDLEDQDGAVGRNVSIKHNS